MGNAVSHIQSISFNLMDGGDYPNKKRLNYAFKEGSTIDPKFFDKISAEFTKDGSAVGQFLAREELEWPMDQKELEAADGFLNTITEKQATEFSNLIQDQLPKFVGQA